jgi:hypothetical protein
VSGGYLTAGWRAALGRALDAHAASGGARDADGYDPIEEAAIVCGWRFSRDGEPEAWARRVLGRPAAA